MNALERTPVRSSSTPNRMGSTKPPKPPARPTMPDTAPMFSPNSSEMNLKTEALPIAMAMPTMNSRMVKVVGPRAMPKERGPPAVMTVNSVCG
ncbi:hypothetical protein D3C72_1004620 [compost metagenome]